MALEPAQASLLDRICAAPLLTPTVLRDAGAFAIPPELAARAAAPARQEAQAGLFD